MPLGYSFTPGLANRFKAVANGANGLPQNASQALQVLSLHLPTTSQGHAPAAPDVLYNNPGITPDSALSAQTAQQGPLSIATPQMNVLAAQATSPSGPPSPFSTPADSGPAPSTSRSTPNISLFQPTPPGAVATPPTGSSSVDITGLQNLFNRLGFGGQDVQSPAR